MHIGSVRFSDVHGEVRTDEAELFRREGQYFHYFRRFLKRATAIRGGQCTPRGAQLFEFWYGFLVRGGILCF